MAGKKTLVVGASPKPDRYSYQAVANLSANGHETIALGNRIGEIGPVTITTEKNALEGIDSVSVYLSAKNQSEYQDYIISLKPKRVIFNPGAENPDFYETLDKEGIEAVEACTLVMLSIGNY